jgi:hypothetical protein
MNPLPKYNEKGELDTRLRVDPVTGDVGIGTPQRTWVGLDKDEFKYIASKYLLNREAGLEYFQEEIEAKLKEKNHGN